MQKVEGSSPFSRFQKSPGNTAISAAAETPGLDVVGQRAAVAGNLPAVSEYSFARPGGSLTAGVRPSGGINVRHPLPSA